MAVSAWHPKRRREQEVFRPSLKLGAIVVLIAGVGVVITGDLQARIMTVATTTWRRSSCTDQIFLWGRPRC